mgnify:CR=1 FL=1
MIECALITKILFVLLEMPRKKTLHLRFNTENTGNLFWRIIIDGKEILAKPQAKILLSGVTINERLIS